MLFLPDDILGLRRFNQVNFFLKNGLSFEVQQLVLRGAQIHTLISPKFRVKSYEGPNNGE